MGSEDEDTAESTDSEFQKNEEEIRVEVDNGIGQIYEQKKIRGEVDQEILSIVRASNRAGAVNLDSLIVQIDEGEEYDSAHPRSGRPTESFSYVHDRAFSV